MKVPVVEKYSKDLRFTTLNLAKPCKIDRAYCVTSERDKLKLVKEIERIVRGSLEYKQYIKFLKDEIDMNCCTFFNNVVRETGSKVRIEIHHEPFTLFDITLIVCEKFIAEGVDLNPIHIAERVMELHYQNRVGLIPLSGTVHDLVHDGRLLIPLQNVYGDYLAFLADEYEYVSVDMRNALQTKIEMSKDIQNDQNSLLEKRYVYLTVDGFILPQRISEDT